MRIKKRIDATKEMLLQQVNSEIENLFKNFTKDELLALAKGDPELIRKATELGAKKIFTRKLALMTPEEILKDKQKFLEELRESESRTDESDSTDAITKQKQIAWQKQYENNQGQAEKEDK